MLASAATTTPLWAKGDMVLIEIRGEALPAPVKITDPKIQEFNIWAGAGANEGALATATGFIIDWKAGIVARLPAGLQHYEVSFYAGCRERPHDLSCLAETPRLVYVVPYDYDPASKKSFVYLPGYGEPWCDLNWGHIYRGKDVEGHWFLATDSWDEFVRPVIAQALRRSN
jgi:hypothetical protein